VAAVTVSGYAQTAPGVRRAADAGVLKHLEQKIYYFEQLCFQIQSNIIFPSEAGK